MEKGFAQNERNSVHGSGRIVQVLSMKPISLSTLIPPTAVGGYFKSKLFSGGLEQIRPLPWAGLLIFFARWRRDEKNRMRNTAQRRRRSNGNHDVDTNSDGS